MKNIQISFDENMLHEVDKVANASNASRSAIIRDAIKYWLREKDIRDFEREWIRSLKKKPQNSKEIEEWTRIQAWSD